MERRAMAASSSPEMQHCCRREFPFEQTFRVMDMSVREIIEKVARHALIIELAAHSKLVQESEAARLVNQRELCVWYINVSYRG